MSGRTPGQAALLFRLERMKEELRPGRRKLFGAILPLGNLFLCAYAERYFVRTTDATPLHFFLVLEALLIVCITVVHFSSSTMEIVKKTRVLPVAPGPLTAFATAAQIRDPLALGVVLTGAFGMAIILHPPASGAAAVVLLFALFMSGAQSVAAGILFVAAVRSDRAAGLALVGIVAGLGALGWSLLFSSGALPAAIPPVRWASTGMLAAVGGAWRETAASFGLLTAVPLAAFLVARRLGGRG